MREVEPFLIRDRANSPLLHGQRAEKDVDRLAVVVRANFIDDQGVRGNRVAFDLRVEDGRLTCLVDLSSQSRLEWFGKFGRRKQCGHLRHDVRVPSARVEKSPELLPFDVDMLSYWTHRSAPP